MRLINRHKQLVHCTCFYHISVLMDQVALYKIIISIEKLKKVLAICALNEHSNSSILTQIKRIKDKEKINNSETFSYFSKLCMYE